MGADGLLKAQYKKHLIYCDQSSMSKWEDDLRVSKKERIEMIWHIAISKAV